MLSLKFINTKLFLSKNKYIQRNTIVKSNYKNYETSDIDLNDLFFILEKDKDKTNWTIHVDLEDYSNTSLCIFFSKEDAKFFKNLLEKEYQLKRKFPIINFGTNLETPFITLHNIKNSDTTVPIINIIEKNGLELYRICENKNLDMIFILNFETNDNDIILKHIPIDKTDYNNYKISLEKTFKLN